jgi:putative FmdB family regulatory protein
MPLFEYACKACERQFEALVRGSESPECPSCHGTALERRQSVFAARTSGPASTVAQMPLGGGCGHCGDPRGPGACSMN